MVDAFPSWQLLNSLPLAQVQAGSNSAIVTFVAYMAIVMFLAWLSSRVTAKSSFLGEYFLGGRSLGVWAFALTFAATSASGGSFIGFPSLVYTHGWSVALWISSYMLVPLVAMGLLSKRLNQISRKTDAITIPDLIRARFDSPVFGLIATMLIVFFMTFNLIAQFKGGSVILQTLLRDVPLFQSATQLFSEWLATLPFMPAGIDPAYLLCLLVFAFAVVLYTTYGGFRAVVWTDVLQGFVMVLGVLILLPLTLIAVGGLAKATQHMAASVPAKKVRIALVAQDFDAIDWSFRLQPQDLLAARLRGKELVFRMLEPAAFSSLGKLLPTSADTPDTVSLAAIQLSESPEEIQHEAVVRGFNLEEVVPDRFGYGVNRVGGLVTLPGPSATARDGFLPLAAAISFFFFFCFATAGQPSNMIRCMAFRDSRTLSRAIFTVSIYYSLIYFPIVIIFCCAKTLLPGWEADSDRIMPEMATTVTAIFGVPWLAGLLVAAPFAAVMSTMDSFLLMISSSVVRDIYGQWINPNPSARSIKVLTYTTTFVVGFAAMLAAINPPRFLQDIIIFTGAGLATSFLVPVALALYWPRFNHQGAIAGMLVGFASNIALYAVGTWLNGEVAAYEPWGIHPFLVGLVASLVSAVLVCRLTPAPREELVLKFFYRRLGT